MGNFAENLNLGNRVRPPPLKIWFFFASFCGSPLRSTYWYHFSVKWEQFSHEVSSTRLHSTCLSCKRKIGINWNFGNKLFMFLSSDSCHKNMLFGSLNIPLSTQVQQKQKRDLNPIIAYNTLYQNIINLRALVIAGCRRWKQTQTGTLSRDA